MFYSATNIYLGPTTLSAITFNFLMSLAGGLLAGYWVSKGDPFWTYSSGLAGIIAASAGNDLYHPIQAMIIAIVGVIFMYRMHGWVERRFRVDDAVGAVAVHGYAGVFGVVVCGLRAVGLSLVAGPVLSPPSTRSARSSAPSSCSGCSGSCPGWVIALILRSCGILRIPEAVEIAGLDAAVRAEVEADEAGDRRSREGKRGPVSASSDGRARRRTSTMSTGNFENWAGNIADIGPIYPFVGAEWLFVLIGVVYWIVWHVRQIKQREPVPRRPGAADQGREAWGSRRRETEPPRPARTPPAG